MLQQNSQGEMREVHPDSEGHIDQQPSSIINEEPEEEKEGEDEEQESRP